MFHIILFEPEIPPNTGNIIRLCANTGCKLHLIEPLGFVLDDKRMSRAGLDYKEWVDVKIHPDLKTALENIPHNNIYALSTKGTHHYHQINYQPDDILLFGPETRGLPKEILDHLKTSDDGEVIRIPMQANSRSLNLSNSVAIVMYEALRQNNFTHPSAGEQLS